MKHATTCKFCHIPITLEIDDEYAALGDPYKLLRLACCNRCSDVRERKRILEDKIRKSAMALTSIRKPSQEVLETNRKNLNRLYRQYAENIARWHNCDGMAWDDAVTDFVMEHPGKWAEALSRLWQMFKQWQAQRNLEI